MRFFLLLCLLLILIIACDNQPFKPEKEEKKNCEELLFTVEDALADSSPALTIITNPNSSDGQIQHNKNFVEAEFSVPDYSNYEPANDSISLRYVIEKTHGILQGQTTEVDIMMPNDGTLNHPIGGFEFLINYDASALSFYVAETGSFFTNCEWEYFTYRLGPFGNCGSACPSGLVKFVGLADTNNGNEHPVTGCTNTEGNEQMIKISFLVSNNRNFECQFLPINFFWIDCAENSVSDESGNYLFWGNRVFDYSGPEDPGSQFNFSNYTELVSPDSSDYEFPSIYGPNNYCDSVDNANSDIYSYVDFFNGGIDIICADSIDDRCEYGCPGDINLDGLTYTIADAVMFSNYFIQGMSALFYHNTNGYGPSVAASDVNGDGITLGVADLVYLIRVIIGDAQPYSDTVLIVDAHLAVSSNGTISTDVEMGAAFVVIAGEVNPTLLADSMEMKYQFDGVNTRVLIWSPYGESFTGEFLQADAELVSIEMATSQGQRVNLIISPAEIALEQNVPNPFNDYTTISFALPETSVCSIWIYNNATCEIVSTYHETFNAGLHSFSWDATGNEPGEYIFRLQVGETIKSITMNLE